MFHLPNASGSELFQKLKILIAARIVFTTLILGSTFGLQMVERATTPDHAVLFLYALTTWIYILSILYILILIGIRESFESSFAYLQILFDTIIITFIVFLTGSSGSIFSFLYLVVIIYASLLLQFKGSLVMTLFSSTQYGILLVLEYAGYFDRFGINGFANQGYGPEYIFYKFGIIFAACLAVTLLSGQLVEQSRVTREELVKVKAHVKQVEKLAAVGELAAGMAHELKNPLASMTGAIQLLKDDLSHMPDKQKVMQIMMWEAERLNALLSNFLIFSKPPTGKHDIIAIDDAINETLVLLEKNQMINKNIRIKKFLHPTLFVDMDPVHLSQILWNILLNAAEAIRHNGVITVTLKPRKNTHAVIEIADNGPGIPQDNLASIFNPFFTTKTKGSGLGLSIVNRIISFYEFRLDIDSRENQGTTVTIVLKTTPQNLPATQAAAL